MLRLLSCLVLASTLVFASNYVPYSKNLTHSVLVPKQITETVWVPVQKNQTVWVAANITQHNTVKPVSRAVQPSSITAQNGKHNFIWGTRSTYDRLLYTSRVKKLKSFLRKVTVDMDFPPKHQHANGTISYIEVLDQEPIGQGGTVSILRGGVGYKNVTLHFKSQRGKSFDFLANIYGH